MAEELSFDNILTDGEIDDLFLEEAEDPQPTDDTVDGSGEKPKKETEETTEVNVDDLFTDEPESVGSGKDKKDQEETPSDKGGTSHDFYSSLAKALSEEGVFPDLDESKLSEVKGPEEFKTLIEEQIRSNLDERQKRIDEALNLEIEPSEIKRYEDTINYLDNIKEEDLLDEGEKGERLRKNLIYQDFRNSGYSHERALREVNKSVDGGTDIEDAKEALKSNKTYFKKSYDTLIEEARKEKEEEIKERKEQAEKLKNSIFNDKNVFGEINLDKNTRQRVYDSISKPVFKDPETGELLTAIQKYESENRTDFLKYVGFFYTMTDGFKNLDNLVKDRVRKEKKKGLSELEHTLNNTARTPGGSLNFASGVNDNDSYLGKGWDLDI